MGRPHKPGGDSPPRPPPRRQPPAAARPAQPPRPQPLLDTSSRTSYRHHRGATSGTAQADFPGSTAKRNTGRAAAITYMATVTPSTTTRTPDPPNHTKTTPSTTWTPSPVDTLNGGGQLPPPVLPPAAPGHPPLDPRSPEPGHAPHGGPSRPPHP